MIIHFVLKLRDRMNSKAFAVLFCLLLSLPQFVSYAHCQDTNEPPSINLIPWPHELKVERSKLAISERSQIVFLDEQLKTLADVLQQEIYQITGLKLATSEKASEPGDILLHIDKNLTGEKHEFVVSDRVTIAGSNYQNTAMASATLLQLLETGGNSVQLPKMSVRDEPHSSYRSLMIDIARQPHTIDTLKQCVMLCRLYKVGFLQIHLNDDQSFAFECKAFPKLATQNHHFTQEELIELVSFADARGVTLIPELDAPGHTTAMRKAMPELFGRQGLSVINLGKEEVHEALEKIISELSGIFKSAPYFHIGADEAYFAVLAKDDDAKAAIKQKGFDDVHDLFYEYIVRVNEVVKANGKKTVMWESFPGTGSKHVTIPNDILIMAWETAYQLPASLLKNDYNIVNVSWKPCYLTPGWRWNPEYIYQWNMFRWENHWHVAPSYDPIQLDVYPNNRIQGGMMCSWESRDEMEIPGIRTRLPAWLERIWAPHRKLPYSHFAQRFAHTNQVFQHLVRPVDVQAKGLTAPGYVGPFYNRENWFGNELTLEMQPLVEGSTIHVTLDGSVPTTTSPIYDSPMTIRESTTVRFQVYDAAGKKLGHIGTIPYEHRPISGQVDGLLMQIRHDNGRGKHRTKFGEQVTVTLDSDLDSGTLRYTTDGKNPTEESPVYAEPVKLTKSGVVAAQCFDAKGQPIGKPWRRSFEQIDAETNLTTGKPVTTSDVVIGRAAPEFAVDGIVDRNFHWDGSSGAPQWWQVDLEDSHKLSQIQVITYWDDRRFYQYRVEVSLDGKNWNEVADYSKNQEKATSEGFLHKFDPIIARYIRVTMLHNSANPGLHLVEVRAFSDRN